MHPSLESSYDVHTTKLVDTAPVNHTCHTYLSSSVRIDQEVIASSLFLRCSDRTRRERLFLPANLSGSLDVDEYLSRIPQLVSRSAELSNEAGKIHDDACRIRLSRSSVLNGQECCEPKSPSSRRGINVLQGEVAHATSLQADILVSANATTCHVVALRSTMNHSEVPALCSLAHIDQVYGPCLENILKHHLDYHERRNEGLSTSEHWHFDATFSLSDSCALGSECRSPNSGSSSGLAVDDAFGFFMDDEELEASQDGSALGSFSFLPAPVDSQLSPLQRSPELVYSGRKRLLDIDLHMVGGFLDKEGTSKKLSADLIKQFNSLARKYEDRMRITLVTAAVSCLNHSHHSLIGMSCSKRTIGIGGPVHRGLGIDTHTGIVFAVPCRLPEQLVGPAHELRTARRAFANEPTLAVIHTADAAYIKVEPFTYSPDPQLNVLLSVSDAILLNVASTSPEQESDTFCSNFRRTLSFVNSIQPDTVFGRGMGMRPLVYTRSAANLHEWIITEAEPNERLLSTSLGA
jgi:Protein N-terminal asparagine amidohydrolase